MYFNCVTDLAINGFWKRIRRLSLYWDHFLQRSHWPKTKAFSAPCKENATLLADVTTPNIFGCYMLRLFALPVACCCELLRRVWNQSTFCYMQTDAAAPQNVGSCWPNMFCPFPRDFKQLWKCSEVVGKSSDIFGNVWKSSELYQISSDIFCDRAYRS